MSPISASAHSSEVGAVRNPLTLGYGITKHRAPRCPTSRSCPDHEASREGATAPAQAPPASPSPRAGRAAPTPGTTLAKKASLSQVALMLQVISVCLAIRWAPFLRCVDAPLSQKVSADGAGGGFGPRASVAGPGKGKPQVMLQPTKEFAQRPAAFSKFSSSEENVRTNKQKPPTFVIGIFYLNPSFITVLFQMLGLFLRLQGPG